jgi:sugar lactone lactonase YvrE
MDDTDPRDGERSMKRSTHVPMLITPASRAVLGESPVWDERTGTFYWVDIERGEIHRCREDGSERGVRTVGERLGCIALRRDAPGFIAGLERRIALLSPDGTATPSPVAEFQDHPVGSRSNDGKCDASGRFWVGTYDATSSHAHSWLYRYDAAGSLTRTLGPFICTNGPAFSPDGSTIYCVDSYGRTVHRCRVSPAGELSEQTVFRRFDEGWGYPDGLTCDAEGCVWIAHWGASRVSRFSPDGELMEAIELPVVQPTSCAFGGRDMRRLFITSASTGLDSGSNANGLAGAVFAVDLPVGGLPAARFAG